jgi:hypothetical protein
MTALVVLLAIGLAAFTYLGLERLGRGDGYRWPSAPSPGPRSDSC